MCSNRVYATAIERDHCRVIKDSVSMSIKIKIKIKIMTTIKLNIRIQIQMVRLEQRASMGKKGEVVVRVG